MATSSALCHLEPKQTVRRSSIWLPPEMWTDVFKFLPRKDLLQSVQPTCRQFHAIAELHVPNVHVIHHFGRFASRLQRNLPEAVEQYTDLSASDASLAKHFRLVKNIKFLSRLSYPATPKRSCSKELYILRYSLDLFLGCRLDLILHRAFPWIENNRRMDKSGGEFLAYLTLLQSVKPSCITVFHGTEVPELHPEKLLREPIMLDCNRLHFGQEQPVKTLISTDLICNWLHHMPIEDVENAKHVKTRFLGLGISIMLTTCAELIECCKKLLQRSESSSDRRSFVLSFNSPIRQVPFRFDHPPTGEVLQLLELYPGDKFTNYHLRRCPIADLASSYQFFHGLKGPTVEIFNYDDEERMLLDREVRHLLH